LIFIVASVTKPAKKKIYRQGRQERQEKMDQYNRKNHDTDRTIAALRAAYNVSRLSPDPERNPAMKLSAFLLAAAVVSAPAIAAAPAPELPAGHPPVSQLPAGHPAIEMTKQGKGAAPEIPLQQKARVLSATNVPQYTYIEVTQNKKAVWLAASTVAVKKGDVIRFDDGMVMTNFHSKSLNRTFPSITFVNRVVVTQEKE
jgi:hypothetical protein